jgi:hypothetical protein
MCNKEQGYYQSQLVAYDVHLTYFRKNGKYYTDGKYVSYKQHLFEIWEEIGNLKDTGKLPGLSEGTKEFHILIEVPNHPHAHPTLFIVKDTNPILLLNTRKSKEVI